jgi:dUTP pyrophosphatase
MSYRMIHTIRRLMCDKFSVLCTIEELNAKQLRKDDSMKVNVRIKRLNEDAVIPKYARDGDAGFDLVAAEDTIIKPGDTVLVSTGLAFEIPPGYEMQIRPRSGVTVKTKLRVQLGTIDSGYRGEIKVIVDNVNPDSYLYTKLVYGISNEFIPNIVPTYPAGTYLIRKGDRICQAIIAPFETCHFVDTDKLEESMRGVGGFGSTGV